MKASLRLRAAFGAPVCASVTALFVCLAALAMTVSSEYLTITPTRDELRLSAPRLHFISGQSLSHLRDGISVPFDFQLALFSGSRGAPVWRSFDRFVVSYDLWEERFAVTRLSNVRRSVSHLEPAAAERWCFDQLSIPTAGLTRDSRLWLRLEIRGEDQKEGTPVIGDDSGISIASLIEVFSRPARRQQQRWVIENGPFRLAEYMP